MSTKAPPWKVTALLTLTIALFAPAAATGAPETVSDAGTQDRPQRQPPEPETATSSEDRNSLTRTEVVVTELERRIDSLERRSRSLALDIAEQQLRELQRNRSRRSAQEREAERQTLADKLDEVNRNLVRLTTLVAILVEQYEPMEHPMRLEPIETQPDP